MFIIRYYEDEGLTKTPKNVADPTVQRSDPTPAAADVVKVSDMLLRTLARQFIKGTIIYLPIYIYIYIPIYAHYLYSCTYSCT